MTLTTVNSYHVLYDEDDMIVPNHSFPSPYLAPLSIVVERTLTEATTDHRSAKRFSKEVRVVLVQRPLRTPEPPEFRERGGHKATDPAVVPSLP